MKVLVADRIANEGIKLLSEDPEIDVDVAIGLKPEELRERIKGYDALIVRSETKVTKEIIEASDKLKVIARAGVGVDNIDVWAATRKGIIVMNAPDPNTISTAEHTIGLMLAMLRNIPQAWASLRDGKWERSKFMGVELCGKTLGIIGFGRIGSEVAKRALAFQMEVIAYDPYVPPEKAAKIGVKMCKTLEELLSKADCITIHVHLTNETRGMIGEREFSLMKPGVRIINCARGGIVDEKALLKALNEGKVAGAALDVFEEEPPRDGELIRHEKVIATPHLGASTEEAQVKVSIVIAEQVRDALKGKGIRNSVNIPSISPELVKELQPYFLLVEKMGSFLAQLLGERITDVKVEYSGYVTDYDTSLLTMAMLKGMLSPALQDAVNYVNAWIIAQERGIKVEESRRKSGARGFSDIITLTAKTVSGESRSISGTLFGKKDPRIVYIDDYHVDAIPEGHILVLSNWDRPGVVGKIGTILGKRGINIASMQFGRERPWGRSIILITTDTPTPPDVVGQLREVEEVTDVRVLEV